VGFLNYYYRSERAARADRYFKAGNDLVLHDRNQEAVEQFRDALSVSSDNREYRLALGLTLVKTGSLEEASVYLEEVLRRDPTNGSANLGLARIADRQGRTAEAVTCYHRAIYGSWSANQAANQLQARFELAAFLDRAALRTQATAELLAIVDRVPNDTAAKKRVGRLLLDYGSPRQSADVFRGLVLANNRDQKRTPGWERLNWPRSSTSPRARPSAAPYAGTRPMKQPSGHWRFASGFWNWIQPFAGSVRRAVPAQRGAA